MIVRQLPTVWYVLGRIGDTQEIPHNEQLNSTPAATDTS